MNAFQLKLIMALLMVLDHIDYIPGFISPDLSGIFHVVTRCVGVWFAFLAVEGFTHTKNLAKYLTRLFSWAAIMFGGNTLLSYLYSSKNIAIGNNIFLTLGCGVLILTVMFYKIKGSEDWNSKKETTVNVLRIILGIAIAIPAMLFTEGGIPLIPFILITYLLRNKPKIRNTVYFAMSAVMLVLSYVDYGSTLQTLRMLAFNSDFMFITFLPFVYLYNGKRGPNTKFTKYFFYAFYPAHLWIIATIGYFVS